MSSLKNTEPKIIDPKIIEANNAKTGEPPMPTAASRRLAPQPGSSTPTAINRKTTGVIAAAFLVGVVGTATVMSQRPSSLTTLRAETGTSSDAGANAGAKEAGAKEAGAKAEPNGTAADQKSQDTLIKMDAAAVKIAGIKTQTVTLAPLTTLLSAPGTVETLPSQQAKISPPVSGRLVRLFVRQGDSVRAGQPLAVLDSYDVAQAHAALRDAEVGVTQAMATVQTAQAQIGQSRAKLNNALTNLARQRQLAKVGAFSQAPLLAAQSEASQAQSELSQAQTELQTKTAAAGRAVRLIQDQLISRSELEQAQADRQQAQARVEQSTMRVSLARQALSREQKVFGGDLLSKQAIQTAEADVRTARADAQTDLRQAQAAETALLGSRGRVGAARDNLTALEGNGHTAGGAGLVTLFAPLSGVVTDTQATLGETVERSAALMTISNTSAVLVQANVPEGEAARVRVGQTVQVTVPTYVGQTFSGVVQTLGSSVDEKTRSLPVRALVENRDGRLKPDMFARVSLATGSGGSGVFVPKTAIDEDGSQRFVYVARGGGYEKRAITVGPKASGRTQVLSGLQPGESVATAGVFVLKSESKKDEMKGDND